MEYNIARLVFLVPIKLTRMLHSGERYLSAPYRQTICDMCINHPYRRAWTTFNKNFSRTVTNTEIPKDTFIKDAVDEGLALIEAKKVVIRETLTRFGFDPGTGKYMKDHLPPELCNKEPEYVNVNPIDILFSMDGSIQGDEDVIEGSCIDKAIENDILKKAQKESDNNPVNEPHGKNEPSEHIKDTPAAKGYSQPDTVSFEYHRKKRGSRRVVAPEKRQCIAEGYVRWMDSLPGEQTCKILNSWKGEKDESQVVYIGIDAVLVPEQAEKHIRGGKEYLSKKRSNVSHWNIRVDWDNSSYHITALKRKDAFLQLIAFLLENGLITRYLIFMTDGETEIFVDIEAYFEPWKKQIYLDFFHIRKKTFEVLSMALISKKVPDPRGNVEYYQKGSKKGQIKKQEMTSLSILYARKVSSLLWTGNAYEAIEYLRNINPDHIKKQEYLDELITKFEKKSKYMTCYALRRRLGLRNSSNGVENTNNTIVSLRQKTDDSHWREKGSCAMAALTAIFKNGQDVDWFERDLFTFKLKISDPDMKQ